MAYMILMQMADVAGETGGAEYLTGTTGKIVGLVILLAILGGVGYWIFKKRNF